MKINKKRLILCLAVPLLGGGLAGLVTMNSMKAFATLNQPPLSPPGWLFPVVWTVLYALMGIASYLASASDAEQEEKRGALWAYGIQLAFNFLWPIVFFNLKWYFFAFLWLVMLWALILITLLRFGRIRRLSGQLLIPYLLWVAFAGYLNLGVYLLNP